MFNFKNQNLILIADRGRLDVAARLAFLSKKIKEKYNYNPVVISEYKYKKFVNKVFNIFGIENNLLINFQYQNLKISIISLYLTITSIFKILFFGFDWFVDSFKIKDIKLGDLIYDRFIRKNHEFIKPSCLKISFIRLIFLSIYKLLVLEKIIKENKVKFSLISSITYISISTLILRLSIKHKVLVIYLAGDHFTLIKNSFKEGDIIKKFIIKEKKKYNKKKLFLESKKYYQNRIEGKLNVKKFNQKNYFEHDELNWKNQKKNKKFINQIKKIKKNFSKTVLYAPHNFAESNHRCGDLLFRDFFQQTEETLKFANNNKNILWLLKIHPYSKIKYDEEKIAKKLFEKYKSSNIIIAPNNINNIKLFDLSDLVVSSRGTICLEAASHGVDNMINCDIFYDVDNISYRVKNKKEYFKKLSSKNISKLNNITVSNAKKILYIRKKLQKENPYNLTTKSKLITNANFCKELENSLNKIYKKNNSKNILYKKIIQKL